MYFKKMVGEKCYLSPIDLRDAEKFAEWLNDLETLSHLQIYNSVINAENEAMALKNLSTGHNYSIIDGETDALIGNCGLGELDTLNQTAEAGIFIGNKDYWNRGYGTEALSLLLDYGFKALNVHNVLIRVYDYNERAKKSYEKIGFKHIGTRRESLLRNLKRHGVHYMDILSSEFYDNRAKHSPPIPHGGAPA
jgi:RimJ/RimL family protein N-acetyltransferase